jgi:predicted MFS family arabinose efflux permease
MVIGPAVGAVASALGRGAVFTGIAVLLAVMALSAPASPVVTGGSRNSFHALWALLHNRRAVLGNALLAVIGVANGTIASLVPLLVVRRGGSAPVIAVILAFGYVLASCWNIVLGRMADRIGRQIPVIGGFILAAVLMPMLPWIGTLFWLAFATVLASSTASGLWTPSAAMVTDSAVAGQSGHAVAVGTMNAAWAMGGAIGAFVVARIAEGLGFTLPFALVGGLSAVAALVTFVEYRRG